MSKKKDENGEVIETVDVSAALEEIKSAVNDETKANKEAIEAAVEKFATADATAKDLQDANKELTEKLSKLEGVIKAMPSTKVAEVETIGLKNELIDGTQLVKASTAVVPITKAVRNNDGVPGNTDAAIGAYHTQLEANPFRALITVFPTTAGSFHMPSVDGITFAQEGSQPAGGRTPGGELASTTITLETFTSENAYSMNSLADVPSLDATVASLIFQEAGKSEAQGVVSNGLNAGGFPSVNTGVAANLPAVDKIVGKMADLLARLDAAYLVGAQFLISRGVYAQLNKADNNGLAFDPANGITTLFGYPITVSGYLQAGNAANHKSAYFGDFGKGVILGSNETVSISRFDQTRPGSLTYYSMFRSKAGAWDTAALVSLKSAV